MSGWATNLRQLMIFGAYTLTGQMIMLPFRLNSYITQRKTCAFTKLRASETQTNFGHKQSFKSWF